MSFTDIVFRLLTEGLLPGVTSVLSFIPTIAILIFFLTLLRESGMVRSDLAPLFMGFSCSVPAVLACSTITDKRSRFLTMFLIPYISCSAKLPIYVMLSAVFFPVFPIAAVCSIYLIGIILVFFSVISARHMGLMQKSLLPSERLRRPSFRVIFDAVVQSCTGFVKKAFTVIFAASVIIWFLQNLDISLHFTDDIDKSLLAYIGKFFAPFFSPLGFGDWRAASALITGLSSKESVISTFAVIAGSSDAALSPLGENALCLLLEDIFTPASAFSFMVFCLLYIPCIATLAAMRNVTKSIKMPLLILLCQTAMAWGFSFLIFHSIKVII